MPPILSYLRLFLLLTSRSLCLHLRLCAHLWCSKVPHTNISIANIHSRYMFALSTFPEACRKSLSASRTWYHWWPSFEWCSPDENTSRKQSQILLNGAQWQEERQRSQAANLEVPTGHMEKLFFVASIVCHWPGFHRNLHTCSYSGEETEKPVSRRLLFSKWSYYMTSGGPFQPTWCCDSVMSEDS